jgi:NADH:ubiquinone oxidoreductase subunit B-like Fe-S oxidoreductase
MSLKMYVYLANCPNGNCCGFPENKRTTTKEETEKRRSSIMIMIEVQNLAEWQRRWNLLFLLTFPINQPTACASSE